MPIPCRDLMDYVFDIFGYCCCQLIFAAVPRVNDDSNKNVLLTLIFADCTRVYINQLRGY